MAEDIINAYIQHDKKDYARSAFYFAKVFRILFPKLFEGRINEAAQAYVAALKNHNAIEDRRHTISEQMFGSGSACVAFTFRHYLRRRYFVQKFQYSLPFLCHGISCPHRPFRRDRPFEQSQIGQPVQDSWYGSSRFDYFPAQTVLEYIRISHRAIVADENQHFVESFLAHLPQKPEELCLIHRNRGISGGIHHKYGASKTNA